MEAPYQSNCTSDWSRTGYEIETEAKYSLAVSKGLIIRNIQFNLACCFLNWNFRVVSDFVFRKIFMKLATVSIPI